MDNEEYQRYASGWRQTLAQIWVVILLSSSIGAMTGIITLLQGNVNFFLLLLPVPPVTWLLRPRDWFKVL